MAAAANFTTEHRLTWTTIIRTYTTEDVPEIKRREHVKHNERLIPSWHNWSDWFTVMKANDPNSGQYEGRINGIGFRLKNERLHEIFKKEHPESCGIYEWRVYKRGGNKAVVYIGSTCSSKPGTLPNRIGQYCHDGSHKADNINESLEKGYDLQFRYKVTARTRDSSGDQWRGAAENEESMALLRFDYAWNVRKVIAIRTVP